MVEFLYPYSFFLLVFLIMFFRKDMKYNINPKLIANKYSTKLKKIFLAIGYILLVISLARPVTDKKEINTHMNIKKVALALDISRSMLASDVYPNRLTFAKNKMKQFIDKFNGDIAIMAFSDTAFLVSPYTTDKNTLKYLLNNIDTSYITSTGTDFQNLIDTAKNLGYKDLVVFSDGGDVKKLDTQGINLYVLLIGNKPSPIKTKNGFLMNNGKMVLVGINKNIANFAKFTKIAITGDSDINSLISQNFQKEVNNKKIVVYKELFIYPLALGLIFLFMAFYSLPKKILPLFLLFTIQAKAGMLDWYTLNQAKEAYNHGNYKQSYQLYSKIDNDEAKYNEANSLYKMKKYKEALKLYSEIKDKKLKEKTLYNEGKCLAKIGKINEAIKKYEEALKINPNDKDAKYNLELLKKHKKKKQNNNQNKKKNSKNNNKQKDNKNNKKKNNNSNSNKKQQKQNKSKEKKQNKDSKKQQKNNHNKQKTNPKKLNQKVDKQNKLKKFKNKNIKKPNNQTKPIQIKPTNNNQIFNKIKSQTLMVPLSKGESKNEW